MEVVPTGRVRVVEPTVTARYPGRVLLWLVVVEGCYGVVMVLFKGCVFKMVRCVMCG